MRRLLAVTTVVVLCSTLFCVVVYAKDAQRATKGTWAGTTTIGPPVNCAAGALAEVTAEGTGVASPWGASTWVGDKTCLFLLMPVGSFTTGLPVVQGSGTATVTTANGDLVNLVMVFTFIGNPGAPNTQGQWAQDVDIIGGTGRFFNAGGHAFSSGVWTNKDGAVSWEGTHEGNILYP